ncbi:metal-binding protein [[Phormidium] sp. ETS-05]|uniref:metal-binding protein n=1 Tax=[Phormidium] sp. ETS-05 TaxID=222819 RepID=UPI0018EF1CA3|nr:metal-binding protein [[Phormidium] sp. ETS-05]
MPSGRTHDRITLWSLPVVTGATIAITRNSQHALLVASGFLFGGLMFGPDLDIYSRQFQRWGWFRWLWVPYQKCLRHRSFWSHGPIIGTVVRVLYLTAWCILFAILAGAVYLLVTGQWHSATTPETGFLTKLLTGDETSRGKNPVSVSDAIALFVGLELGALSHSLSDYLVSSWKRKIRFVVGANGHSPLQPKKNVRSRASGQKKARSTLLQPKKNVRSRASGQKKSS